MANEIKIAAEPRNEFGKGAARRIRRAGQVPVVLYGHGTDPVHLTLPAHETLLALRTANALLALDMPGGKQLALPKQVQRDPIRGTIEHVDLLLVKRGEKVIVEIPLNFLGEVEEGIVNVEFNSIPLEVEATDIPKGIDIDLSKLVIGDRIAFGDVALPEGASFAGEDADDTVASVLAARAEAAADSEEASAEDAE